MLIFNFVIVAEVFLIISAHLSNAYHKCPKIKIKTISSTKCVAGRRFYARLDHVSRVFIANNNETTIQPYAFPWIGEIESFYAGLRSVCTGTLINDRYVLTAQHCVSPPLEAQHLNVTLGFYGVSSNEKPATYEVLSIILHPDYDPDDLRTSENDLGLLRIPTVQYTRTVYPIQLPTIADTFTDFTDVTAENAGWSYPDHFENTAVSYDKKTFHQITLKIINDNECRNFNEYYRRWFAKGVLCTKTLSDTDRSGYCKGDSGGPLLIEKTKRIYNITILAGIQTWSWPKNKPCVWYGAPVVFVRIDRKLSWIKKNTKDALYCRY